MQLLIANLTWNLQGWNCRIHCCNWPWIDMTNKQIIGKTLCLNTHTYTHVYRSLGYMYECMCICPRWLRIMRLLSHGRNYLGQSDVYVPHNRLWVTILPYLECTVTVKSWSHFNCNHSNHKQWQYVSNRWPCDLVYRFPWKVTTIAVFYRLKCVVRFVCCFETFNPTQ